MRQRYSFYIVCAIGLCRLFIHNKPVLTNFAQNIIYMEEDKIIETGATDARARLEELLVELLPEEQRTGSIEEMALTWIEDQRAMNRKISETLAENPEFAQAMAEVVNGRSSGATALARYFGRDFLSAEEGTPEYEELMNADKAWKEERDAARKAAEEFDKAMEKSQEEINAYCAAKGIDPDEYQDRIEAEFIVPIFSGNIDAALLAKLDKAMDYDKDTEDAFAAGEVKGRNENINKLRAQPGDGMPKGLGTQAPVQPKKRRGNPLIEAALQA